MTMNLLKWFTVAAALLSLWSLSGRDAQAKNYIAYISDSTNSSMIYWIAKEAAAANVSGRVVILTAAASMRELTSEVVVR